MHILSAVLCSFFVRIRTRIGEERGASLVEYALLLALIALLCIGAIRFIGVAAGDKLSSTTSGLR